MDCTILPNSGELLRLLPFYAQLFLNFSPALDTENVNFVLQTFELNLEGHNLALKRF